jgi:trehalose 6-phosphate phosphatase
MCAAWLPEWRDDWALFLDVDGTLLEIAATPAAVRVPARVVRVLGALQRRLSGAVALVSGRSIAELDRLFAPLELAAAGVHGAERRVVAGRVQRHDDGHALAPARRLLADWCAGHSGALLEDKGTALALHYRSVPELEPSARRVVTDALAALPPGFHVQEGKKVLEIKPDAVSKGHAIESFLEEAPFLGRLPVFVGDDVTDEDGFDVVNRRGGHSIAVGRHGQTHARFHLADERAVLDWLERCAFAEGN